MRNLAVSILYQRKFLMPAPPFIEGRSGGISASRFESKINPMILNRAVFISR